MFVALDPERLVTLGCGVQAVSPLVGRAGVFKALVSDVQSIMREWAGRKGQPDVIFKHPCYQAVHSASYVCEDNKIVRAVVIARKKTRDGIILASILSDADNQLLVLFIRVADLLVYSRGIWYKGLCASFARRRN